MFDENFGATICEQNFFEKVPFKVRHQGSMCNERDKLVAVCHCDDCNRIAILLFFELIYQKKKKIIIIYWYYSIL